MSHNLFNWCCHFVYGDAVMWLKCVWHPWNAIFTQNFAMSTIPAWARTYIYIYVSSVDKKYEKYKFKDFISCAEWKHSMQSRGSSFHVTLTGPKLGGKHVALGSFSFILKSEKCGCHCVQKNIMNQGLRCLWGICINQCQTVCILYQWYKKYVQHNLEQTISGTNRWR